MATEVMKFLQAQAHARLLQDLQMECRLDKLEQMIRGREYEIRALSTSN